MLTAQEIKNAIEKAEKQKQELQELIDSLNTVEAEPGRAGQGQIYFYTDNAGKLSTEKESGSSLDEHRYNTGNYYLDKKKMLKAEKQVLLFRLLDRFSRQNGWTDELWEDDRENKWYIYFSYNTGESFTTAMCYRDTCQVYFASESVAKQAIEKYHDLIMEVMAI